MTVEEQLARLTGIVDSLASSVVAHDNPIEALIKVAERQNGKIGSIDERLQALLKATEQTSAEIRALERQWQAYLNTLPRQ